MRGVSTPPCGYRTQPRIPGTPAPAAEMAKAFHLTPATGVGGRSRWGCPRRHPRPELVPLLLRPPCCGFYPHRPSKAAVPPDVTSSDQAGIRGTVEGVKGQEPSPGKSLRFCLKKGYSSQYLDLGRTGQRWVTGPEFPLGTRHLEPTQVPGLRN